jgi:hypothetical protein
MRSKKKIPWKMTIIPKIVKGTVRCQTQCRCGSGGNNKCGGKCNK